MTFLLVVIQIKGLSVSILERLIETYKFPPNNQTAVLLLRL